VLVKDADLIDEANAELGLEAPLFALSGELLRRASELGHGDADPGIVAELLGYPDA
jgi:3-hydroxyisobutyrate dehydrogenase-like beta-hydroxyacid dehydrogenase